MKQEIILGLGLLFSGCNPIEDTKSIEEVNRIIEFESVSYTIVHNPYEMLIAPGNVEIIPNKNCVMRSTSMGYYQICPMEEKLLMTYRAAGSPKDNSRKVYEITDKDYQEIEGLYEKDRKLLSLAGLIDEN